MTDDHTYDGSNYADAECYMEDAHSLDFDGDRPRALIAMAFAQVKAALAIADALADLKPEPATVTHLWQNPLTATHPWPPWPSTLPDVTGADRYAANEERQREAEADPLDPSMAECSRCGQAYPGTPEALLAHHGECTGEDEPEMSEAAEWLSRGGADPLDEDDHRDRVDADGTEWRRAIGGCWHPTIGNIQSRRRCHWNLAYIQSLFGPLAFAPDADGAPSVTAPAADDPAGDAVDGEVDERRNLNAQTTGAA